MVSLITHVASLVSVAAAALASAGDVARYEADVVEAAVAEALLSPRDMHLRFWLDPGEDGARTLVLRDDEDLWLPLGTVDASSPCYTRLTERPGGDTEMYVVCGGDPGLLILVSESSRTPRRDPRVTVTVDKVGAPEMHEIRAERGARVWLDSHLLDPGEWGGIPRDDSDVLSDILAGEPGPDGPPEWWGVARSLHLSASGVLVVDSVPVLVHDWRDDARLRQSRRWIPLGK
jgi:hypothetical protein